MSVDFPAPFWPMSACTSPRPTSRLAAIRAGTPAKRLSIPRMERSGVLMGSSGLSRMRQRNTATPGGGPKLAEWLESQAPPRPGGGARRSVRVADELSGVRLVEEAVGIDHPRLDLVALRVARHRLESFRTELRIAL